MEKEDLLLTELLEVVDDAVYEYGSDRIDVILNEETNMLYVSFCSHNNSFAVSDKEWDIYELDEDILTKELNKRHVGICGW